MNEILTIDTGSDISPTIYKDDLENYTPLKVHNEHLPLLHKRMPEYDGDFNDPIFKLLISDLKKTRKIYGAVGLSANQCNIEARVFVLGTDDYDLVCVNPEIVSFSEDEKEDTEGCLSYPGLFFGVKRPKDIVVKFQDQDGVYQTLELSGITAKCFMHELDHLNGITFTQRVGPVTLLMANKKRDKLIKKTIRSRKKKQLTR